MSAGYTEGLSGRGIDANDNRDYVDHQLAPFETRQTPNLIYWVHGEAPVPLQSARPDLYNQMMASRARAIQNARDDAIFCVGPDDIPTGFVMPRSSGLPGTRRPELGQRPAALQQPVRQPPPVASASRSLVAAALRPAAVLDSATNRPANTNRGTTATASQPSAVFCVTCNETVTEERKGVQCALGQPKHVVHTTDHCSSPHSSAVTEKGRAMTRNDRACKDCLLRYEPPPVKIGANGQVYNPRGRKGWIKAPIQEELATAETPSKKKRGRPAKTADENAGDEPPKKRTGRRKKNQEEGSEPNPEEPKSDDDEDDAIDPKRALISKDPSLDTSHSPWIQKSMSTKQRRASDTQMNAKRPRKPCFLVDSTLHEGIMTIAYCLRFDKRFNNLILKYVEKESTLLENGGSLLSMSVSKAATIITGPLSTWMSDYRYFCDYMDLMSSYVETTPNTAFLADYYWKITGTCVNIFLKLQFERPSKRGKYTGDRGKKGSTVNASHKAAATFFEPLVSPLSPGEDLCCEDRNACKAHADVIKDSNSFSAAAADKKHSRDPFNNISGAIDKFLEPDLYERAFEFCVVRHRGTAEPAGLKLLKVWTADCLCGGRAQDLQGVDYSEVGSLSLHCDPSKKLLAAQAGVKLGASEGDTLYGTRFKISGTKTHSLLAKKGQSDTHFFCLGEAATPWKCFMFANILAMMIDVHGYGDAPPNFMGGIDALRKSYVFEGNSSEKAFSSPAMNAQMNKLFEHLRVKIEDKALHAMRTVHVELLKKKDVPTDHYKSLWNFTDKEGKDVTDAHYAKSTPDTVVKATADHDPFATKIIIWHRVPIPSSLSSLVFNGAIVRFRDALNDPVKCKELAQYWDADQSKWVYNGLESLKVICDWWEASANCFYYNMAYVRLYSKVYDTKPGNHT
ncbi:hypothetical protein BDR26DRAFT_904470 [Obelidium mucronatum]|nr:hypothetical protein BDR26DRAFT_904470 [Obelidium mucronatum]